MAILLLAERALPCGDRTAPLAPPKRAWHPARALAFHPLDATLAIGQISGRRSPAGRAGPAPRGWSAGRAQRRRAEAPDPVRRGPAPDSAGRRRPGRRP